MTAALLTNVIFWSGLAIGGVVFAALLEVTGGTWAGPLRIIAERFRWFLPLSFIAVLVLMWKGAAVYPWARAPLGDGWWTPWFVAARADAALAIVYVAAFAFCRSSRRARRNGNGASAMASAVVFLLVYVVGFSSFTADAIMSLEPQWTSTLFPAYVFTANVYAGIAAVALLGGRNAQLTHARGRDMANLLVGTALLWLYLFWSQFLVIWYGNLTSEVGYVIRHIEAPRAQAWTVLLLACALPAAVFIPQRGKRAAAVRAVAPLILVGLWMERWLLVAPDVPSRSILAGIVIALLFGAAFLGTIGELVKS